MFKSVLMVCVGNICRSPMAEAMLKLRCDQSGASVHIASAGIAALVGHPADTQVQGLMAAKGIDVSEHKARQLTVSLMAEYDLVLVMEEGHIKAINKMVPESRGRVHLLGKWNDGEEIADPYRKTGAHFKAALSAIERGIVSWEKYL